MSEPGSGDGSLALLAGADDTIVAQATPAGRGAVALIRVSGRRAHEICRASLECWPERPREAVLTHLHDRRGAVLDECVAVRYDAPASFTGENMVEISVHGGVVVPATAIAALIDLGARQALGGEFTRRAVLAGKLDVLQAEAIGDLIDASSRAAQRVALGQLDGGLSRRVLALRDEVLAVEALVAYDIDFPEEDEGPVAPQRVLDAVARAVASLEGLLATARSGELVREGALVVLAGAPNVGKSSLFNALVGRNRAIVTDIPGTTRDAIEAVVDSGSWPLRLVDTAGLRQSADLVERLGVEISEDYLRRAAVVLACGDDDRNALAALRSAQALTTAPVIGVRTKADLSAPSANELNALRKAGAAEAVAVSAETGRGIRELEECISTVISRDVGAVELDAPILTQARHRYAIETARAELESFRDAWREKGLPMTVAAVHLRQAVTVLQDLIGAVDVEDVLEQVFRRFCVGK